METRGTMFRIVGERSVGGKPLDSAGDPHGKLGSVAFGALSQIYAGFIVAHYGNAHAAQVSSFGRTFWFSASCEGLFEERFLLF